MDSITNSSDTTYYRPLISTDMSKEVNEIALALSKAQSDLESAKKGSEGYGYNYSDLTTVINTAKPVLAKHELAITQLVGNSHNGDPVVTTILVHSSGQFFKSIGSIPLVDMKGVNNAQKFGASLSYLRRYALQGILNMSSEDNDASSEGFTKPSKKTSYTKSASKPQKFRKSASKSKTSEDASHDI